MHLIKSALFLILFACLPFSASAAPAAAKPPVVATTPTEASTAEVVNINTADEATLVRGLNGVGEVKAKAIVEYRTAHGPFVSLDQLLEVKGVGPALLEKNRERIAIE
ncbi:MULTISPECIES: ComEA family DNA-binding protein [Pseudomonas]|uniref:ComEA family DNA-binding protein n=2 Tax=Pseudomonas aeruginosa group TaxID=136841 RepID=A0ABD7K3F4_PSEAI|nr:MULTISPECIES: ComEA family DNA-binding protein [Pseudomonas aeruginosa group]KFF35411.1 competence protein ComEA [Pseudomonas aeruginosa VRFPA01]AVK03706.1 competence ComEA helix-hairpin-helix repeat region domain protein [Pseudomonas paraeruginosa]AVR67156.1 ComEA family DNA-binding protein [Pseudomonas paraeruginosa]AWE92707.1 competence ComEA helix-hairpin-helix repeat region domain protein [Pseudomonas paraeruginosa]AYZ85947.1 ComEA family DNA-binding protein [Pseudomonas aeruginosa]